VKVLHLDISTEWRGGQQQVLYLTRGLEERGVVSVVATTQGSPLAQRLRRQDLPVLELPATPIFAPKLGRALQHILADRTWHILHAHTAHAHTLGFLAFRVPPPRSFHRPSFVVARRVDFVPSRDPLTRLKYTNAGQTIVCVSEAIRRVLLAYGVAPDSLRVVPSGVQLPGTSQPGDPLPSELDPQRSQQERLDLRAELGVPSDALLLGNIAQMVEHKGQRYLLEAMPIIRRAVPSAHLVILGNGELEKDLRRRAAQLSLDGSVTFAGFRPDAARYLPALDLFVLSSVEEGLGTSTLDAQAAGVPVVVTRAGGSPEAVLDGETGLLAEPADAEALASQAIVLLNDQPRRVRMGIAGRRHVADAFSADRTVDMTLAIYRELTGRP
jgi:glycosyltransferase involved in cell wall biosynthesis